MHKNFGEWYRLVAVERTEEILKKRWAGVEEWLSTVRDDEDALLETVRIFHGLPARISREEFLEAFRKHDAAFAKRNNELELRVLAGATLVQCILVGRDQEEDEAGWVRTAVIAGTAIEASRLRASDDLLEEMTREVHAGLQDIARNRRKRSDFRVALFGTKEEALTGTLEQVTNAPDHNQLRTHVVTAFQTLMKALHCSRTALEGAAHDLRCADEETNILWWIMGGSSRDLNKPWSALKEAAPLVAGLELADLTDVALGPQDAAALLGHLISEANGKSEERPIYAYVNAVPEEWATARAANLDERAVDLAPLSLALLHRSKSDTSVWQPFFESNSGLNASTGLTPERVARLAYIEGMLFSTITKAEC